MNVDDLLFEPISGSNTGTTGPGAIIKSPGIDRYADSMSVEIHHSGVRQHYIDAAVQVLEHAVINFASFPLEDVRKTTVSIPKGALNLMELTDRFYDRLNAVWLSRSRVMRPTLVHFTGQFGFMKYYKMPTLLGAAETGFFYRVGSSMGELAMIDLGLVCVHKTMSAYHMFTTEFDAENWFKA